MHQPPPICFSPQTASDLERLRDVLRAGVHYYAKCHHFDGQIFTTIAEIEDILENYTCEKSTSRI